ncbi:MAG: neutral zinc metallopeptidase, partial [Finegoldia magna]|nr:neutral zinc metallopeptidase [Finegoldia magna]
LNIFKDQVKSGCGIANAGMGPFSCSRDEAVYMDLSFYDSLINDFGADEGDFILSYVISHEVGHHVQTITGVMQKYQEQMANLSEEEQNALTVRLELQADYLAGVVARYQKDKGYLDPGDIDEAISAAWSIGDDTIQKKSQGHVKPESFTHGTSAQRTRWFKKGYETGDLSNWDTFSAKEL